MQTRKRLWSRLIDFGLFIRWVHTNLGTYALFRGLIRAMMRWSIRFKVVNMRIKSKVCAYWRNRLIHRFILSKKCKGLRELLRITPWSNFCWCNNSLYRTSVHQKLVAQRVINFFTWCYFFTTYRWRRNFISRL